ncbi:MAG: NADH:quinone oxidoreductase subunit N [Candidatus Westeberhardia cardiocondylae]|nr:NADH:quinone oxidoreductase subunit N [Candidatus Westeberhardia cardiocondylae]
MNKIPTTLIALLPLLTISITILIILLNITWKNNQTVNMYLTSIGLNLAIYFTKYCNQKIPIYIAPLITIDKFSIFYTNLILLGYLIINFSSHIWIKTILKNQRSEFYILLLISSIGSIILCSSENFLTLFFGIEIISLTLFGIIGYNIPKGHNKSLEITTYYIILSIISSSFLIFGIALIYAYCGDLSFYNIKELLQHNTLLINHPMILIGVCMITIGIGFKLSLAPFHYLSPQIYQQSPSQHIIFITINKITIFLATMRFFSHTLLIHNKTLCQLLISLASISILLGTCMALKQKNIKKLLSYSSIATLGYLTISLTTITPHYSLTIEGTGVYILGYLIATIGVLNIISIISKIYTTEKKTQKTHLTSFYKGLFWKHPYISIAFTTFLLSLAGIPITIGFIGKLYIIMLSIHNQIYWVTIITIIGTIINMLYYIYIITILYLPTKKTEKNKIIQFKHTNYYRNFIIIIFSTLTTIFLGIYPKPLITILQTIK